MPYLEQEEFERDAVGPANFVLEVENLDEVVLVCYEFFFGYTLGIDLSVLAKIQNRMVSGRLPVDPIRAGLIYPDLTAFGLIGNLGFLNQALD